jgi:UDP-N-acetylglucosamine acyltransferase
MAIHPTAIVDSSAEIDPSAEIGPYSRVEANCRIGPGCVLMQGAVVCVNTVMGEGNILHYHAVIGDEPQFLGFDPKIKSGTLIGNRNVFREGCQIHRGLKDGTNTVIGDGNFFMATSHVAHDCHLGNNNVIANYAGLAGHVEVGDKCFISTLVGVHQFCRIGSFAMIGGRTGISKDVPPYVTMKHYGLVVGLNVVGLRRAGVKAETRTALKEAYKELFRSGRPLPASIDKVRTDWSGREMPAELAHFLDFCATKSKRGISKGPRAGFGAFATEEGGEDDDE